LPTDRAVLQIRPAAPTRRDALAAATRALGEAGVESPRVDAEWLLAGILGVGRPALYLGETLSPEEAARYAAAVRRRARREPLQRVLGWEEFHGLRVRLTEAVLVPRPETEVLVDWALTLLAPCLPGRHPRVVDVGTGSGCVACALAALRPDLAVIALDVAADALHVARANVAALDLSARVGVVASDLLGAVRAGSADMIVSNPPYLPTGSLAALPPEVRDHEPWLALDGGPDGLAVIRRLAGDARGRLVPGGTLVLETAGGPQASAAAALMREAGFDRVLVHNDLAGIERFVAGRG
jgi:release factor glutamine methyltransferase